MAHAEPLLLLLLSVAAVQAVLNSGQGWNRQTTLCQNALCGCDPSMHTMRCSCPNKGETLHLKNETIPVTLKHLIVSHCSHVIVYSDALSAMAYLSTVQISQVESLQLQERAFFYEPHRLVFGQVEAKWVHEVYPEKEQEAKIILTNISDVQFPRFTFGGHIEEISLEGVRVSRFNSYAVANTYSIIRTLKMVDCSIDYFAFQSLRKVLIEDLVIKNCRIHTIESSSFKEVLVRNNFQFVDNRVEKLASSALGLIGPEKVQIARNKLLEVHGDAFHIFTRGTVLISDNIFYSIRSGALRGLSPYRPQFYPTLRPNGKNPVGDYPQLLPEPWEEQERPHEVLLNNNTLMEYEQGALALDKGYRVAYQKVQLNLECECDGITLVAAELLGIHTGINGLTVLSAQNTSFLHKSLWCKQSRPSQVVSFVSYEDQNCQGGVLSSGWSIAIIVAASILFVVLFIGLALIFWCSYRRNKLLLVVPAKKTYHQTEFNVVYEPVTELQIQKMPKPIEVPPELQTLNGEERQRTTYATVQRVGGSKETVYENIGEAENVIYEELQPVSRRVTFANRSENSDSREFLESEII